MHKNNIMSKFFGLSSLSLSTKRVIILGNDFIVALICWLVFGPPMATWPCECGWEEENEGVKVGEGGILFYCGGVCV